MIYCNALALINALGADLATIQDNLTANRTGLTKDNCWLLQGKQTYLGEIKADLISIPSKFPQHNSRNNRLLLTILSQIQSQLDSFITKYGASRIAIIMGTSTSGIREGELAIKQYLEQNTLPDHYDYQQQQFGDPSLFLAEYLNVTGPAYTISTACSSSARAIISGANLINSGLVDVALVGGADTLCQMAINGFNALEAISEELCTPFAHNRSGINIGEAAGLMILSKEPSATALLGWGASSDAWHMSAPHPEGIGAEAAMRTALTRANLTPEEIGYINLHGTATPLNDSAESKAVHRIFNDHTPCSSTKHLTGHTLGAAGITEAGFSVLISQNQLALPKQLFTDAHPRDPTLEKTGLITDNRCLTLSPVLSNSFAFGGNNASLIFGQATL